MIDPDTVARENPKASAREALEVVVKVVTDDVALFATPAGTLSVGQ